MRFGVLGPLTVWTDAGVVAPIPGAKVRALLADLLVTPGQPVPADRLVDDIWGEDPPGNPAGTLAAKASQLRRALADAEPGGRELVVSPPPGYRVIAENLDAQRFRELMAAARAATEPAERVGALTAALSLWRGPAFADFRDAPFTQPVIAQLEEQRLVAVEELAEARLALGEYGVVAGELTAWVGAHPLRERLRAAHLRALYGAGRQAEALAGFEDLRRRLADELGLDPSPELAGLQRSILSQELPSATPRPETVAGRRRSNIPAQRTELVGRDADLAELTAAVAAARMVTLTGPGGVGKTRLALAAAAAVAGEFPHGSWLVELAPLQQDTTSHAFLADAVARALDIRAGADADPVESLCEALADRELLLVLDNCEHVVEHAAELAELLLGAAPALRILATSREPLRLPGEDVVSVRPLDVPAPGALRAEIGNYSAVELFVTRARAGARDFTLDADTAEPVATLCRRLDGIPLALELAATRVRSLGVADMVARLDDRFALLATGHRGAPPRQRTLAAMIDWSWSLLDPAEQAVLRRLAVHVGGCELDAAEAVCAATSGAVPLTAAAVADLVGRLVDRSLVQVTARRYRLLESVAAFSLDRLAEAGESDAAHRAHHRYYLRLAERAAPELQGADQRRWLHRLDADTANLRAALDAFVRERDAERALRLVNALAWYWQLRGRLTEARRRLDAALALGGPPLHRARALAWNAGFTFQQGEFGDGAARRAEVFALYDQLDDPAGRARAALFLAFSALESGDLAELETLVRSALPICEQLGDRWGVGCAHVSLAKAAHNRVDLAALERHARTAALVFAELDDRWGRLQAAEWLGGLAELTGDLGTAAAVHSEALALAQELELWGQACSHLCWLGWIAMQQAEFGRARTLAERAERLAGEHGYGPGRMFAAVVLAFTARRDGRPAVAERILRDLLASAVSDGEAPDDQETPLFLPMLQVELGYLLEQRGDAAAALALHLTAFDGAQRIAAPRDTAFALAALAADTARAGRFPTAARLLGAAEAVREAHGMPLLPAERPDIDRPTELVRTALGEPAFREAHAAGRELTPARARALAAATATEIGALAGS